MRPPRVVIGVTGLALTASLSIPAALSASGSSAVATPAPSRAPSLFATASAAVSRQAPDLSRGRAKRTRYVSFRGSRLPSAARGQHLDLGFFDDADFTATVEHVDSQPMLTSWSGSLDTSMGSFVATKTGDTYSLTANTLQGTFTMSRVAGGSYQVEEVAAPPVPKADDTTVAPTGSDAAARTSGVARHHKHKVRGGDDGSVEDILVAYTAGAEAAYGGVTGITAEAAKNIGYANAAYASSGVQTTLRLVGVLPVSGTEEGGDLSNDLAAFSKSGDGQFDEVFGYVKQTHADDAMLLERPYIDSDTVCGRAYEEHDQPASFAFGVLFTGSCTDGFTTFPHELGHNQGASHDYYTATTPGAGFASGAKPQFPYGYGYVAPNFAYYTIMAYQRECNEVGHVFYPSCPYIFSFANPGISYGGQATGEPVHSNVAQLISKTRKTMARHQQSTLYLRGSVHIKPAPSIGKPVRAVFKGWVNGRVHTTFQWYRDGKPIKHAKHRTYRPTRKDAGKKLAVVVTGAKRYYAPVAIGSGSRKVKGPGKPGHHGHHGHHHGHHGSAASTLTPAAAGVTIRPNVRTEWV